MVAREIEFTRCKSQQELEQILLLQKQNLPGNISTEEKISEGFVTVSHTLSLLDEMNQVCPHVIAKSGQSVVGYALCMHPVFGDRIPILKPMFDQLLSRIPKDQTYMVMGQICIDKLFRKKGLFRGLYSLMKKELKPEYDLIITEVDAENIRSLNAHYAVGFEDLHIYNWGSQNWHLIQWKL